MEPCKRQNNILGLSQTPTRVVNGKDSRQPVHRRPARLMSRVREELGGMEAERSGSSLRKTSVKKRGSRGIGQINSPKPARESLCLRQI